MKTTISTSFKVIVLCYLLISCNKEEDFLDVKPNIALVVPSKLDDYQLLLYREDLFNRPVNPALGLITTDEYYVNQNLYNIASVDERNAYIFGKGDIYETVLSVPDWQLPYTQIYYANIVLEGIEKIDIKQAQQQQYNQIKGQALFFRAHAFYNLVQTFSLPYDSLTSTTDLGIILRLSSDFNIKAYRSTVQQTYDQILEDLATAIDLLPLTTPFATQPSKAAGNALMARIYLAMGKYPKALEYADATLALNNILTDYNTLTPTNTQLSTTYLKEDIFHTELISKVLPAFSASLGGTTVDSNLYALYDNPNDLRKALCYRVSSGRVEFRGTYTFLQSAKYSGLATDEIYLIRAECRARAGNTTGAMSDVNTLLRARWKKNGTVSTYVDQTVASPKAALDLILKERRKELPFRGLRWTDIRRLNKESDYQTTLVRVFNGVTYTLPPGDPRFAMPIPFSEIQLSGIEQNKR